MTTIAYRDGLLAADTAMCAGGTMMGSIVKIARRADGDMAGAAGDASYNHAFLKWFLQGEVGTPPEAKEADAYFDRGVIFRGNGAPLEVFEARGQFRATADYFAFGSGRELALGAMYAGCDAIAAIKCAINHDPHTGGEITVLNHAGTV